jgi:hypothetical protein
VNNSLSILFSLLFISLLSACSATSPVSEKSAGTIDVTDRSNVQRSAAMKTDDLLFVLLRSEFQYWKGTPYSFGGQTKKGIDCSALVQNVYENSFHLPLPRVAKRQAATGLFVYKNAIQVGDLLFFKTGWKELHVGIYMGDKQFFHASSSNGVMISSLDNVYWQSKYWQARRIIDE